MSIKDQDEKVLHDLLNRMKRIEGQSRGIQRLLEEGAECDAIVIQLSAMRSALSKVAVIAASCQLSKQIADEINGGGNGRDALNEMMDTFLRIS